jgi:ElaB/YqjD/DUF883 family membrane-anchored ribosome-binding protein
MRYLGQDLHPVAPTNGSRRHRSAAQVERDADAIGRDMASTLRQLEEKVSPRELLTRVTHGGGAISSGGGDFVKNLATALRDHPIPALLLMSGVASLLASERADRKRPIQPITRATRTMDDIEGVDEQSLATELGERLGEKGAGAREKAEELRARAHDKAEELRARAHGKTEELRARAHETSEELRSRAHEAQAKASAMQKRVREQASNIGHNVSQRSQDIIQEQPLILVGLGLTFGAILAAGLPDDLSTLTKRTGTRSPMPGKPMGGGGDGSQPQRSELLASSDRNPFEADREVDVEAEQAWSLQEQEEAEALGYHDVYSDVDAEAYAESDIRVDIDNPEDPTELPIKPETERTP